MNKFEENVNLVYYVFNKDFASHRDSEEDLIQEGMIGLWKACQTFDASKKFTFSTYATICIRNQMAMYMRKEMKRIYNTTSLEAILDKGIEDKSYIDVVKSKSIEPDDIALLEAVMKEAQSSDCYVILQMKLKGETQDAIAKKLNMSPVRVSEKLRKFYQRMKEKFQLK